MFYLITSDIRFFSPTLEITVAIFGFRERHTTTDNDAEYTFGKPYALHLIIFILSSYVSQITYLHWICHFILNHSVVYITISYVII